MADVVVPELAQSAEKITLSFWFHKQGDRVEKDSDLVELVTDKATINVPAPEAGVLKQILIQEGATVNPGDVLGVLE